VLLGALGAGVATAVLAACGEDGPARSAVSGASVPEETSGGDGGSAVQVRSSDNTFTPKEVTVPVGTTVEWLNRGSNNHDILPAEGNPLTDFGIAKDDFPPKTGVYRYTFTEPGRYDYYCSIHGNQKMKGMVGTVIVE